VYRGPRQPHSPPFNEQQWAKGLYYTEQDTDDARQLFTAIRRSTYKLFKLLPEADWSHTAVHPVRGVQSLDDLLTIAEQHAHTHIDQIKHNLNLWHKQH
jgi:hypothetical protein